MKNIYFIILSILILIYIIHSVRKNTLSVKTSFWWVIAALGILVLSIFPYTIDWLAKVFNISYGPALFLTLCVVVLFVIDFNYSKTLAEQQKKIIELEQHIALLEGKVNEKK